MPSEAEQLQLDKETIYERIKTLRTKLAAGTETDAERKQMCELLDIFRKL